MAPMKLVVPQLVVHSSWGGSNFGGGGQEPRCLTVTAEVAASRRWEPIPLTVPRAGLLLASRKV